MAELQALVAQATGRTAVPAPATAPLGATGTATTGTGTGSAASFASALTTASATTAASATTTASAAVPAGVPTGGPDGGRYAGLIQAAAQRHGVDPQIFTNLVRQESGFDPTAGSPAGARGLCQLMPGTARALGVTDVTDPAQSLEGGAKYLRQQLDRFGGDYEKALAAYNAGPGAVQRHGGVPPYAETQHYVSTILGTARA
ncbi:MAG: transglycosylase SLT domain-containing protein [Actinobacteria bacterium]|nr:transglycosylase SLT domain-containing protein [Actinomycetota bacterium]